MSRRLIAHLAPFLQGGAGRVISSLATAQRRAGDRVVVATGLTGEPGFENYAEYLTAIRECGAELVTVDSLFKRDRSLNDSALAAIARVLGDARPTVVHAHAAIPAEIGLTLGTPVVQTMHGWSRNKKAAHIEQDLSIMSRVDLVVFPSHASLQELVTIGGHFKSTDVIPNGIPADLPPALAACDDLRALKANGTRVIVTIGSLTTQKHHAVLIDALPGIAEQHDVVVVLVGEGPERDALSARASALGVTGRVWFRGYLEEASAILAVADLLVQPSLTESFGLAVIEAYRAGVPVVASRIPALSELVAASQCGWMFDPASPQDLARAVNAALAVSADEQAVAVDHARRYFNSHFTIDRMVDRYNAAYASVCHADCA